MLRFFRHIRKTLMEDLSAGLAGNRIRTYLLYAIGEILLVVVGILIALQVNNWNEERKEAYLTGEILYNLSVDIEEDLNNLESLKEMLSGRKSHADYLLRVINDTDEEIDPEKLLFALTRVGWILNYTPTFATYNEITNSGRLSLIKSVELKKLLADYKSQVQDNRRIEESYEPGLKVTERLSLSFMDKVPDANNLFTGAPRNDRNLTFDLKTMRENKEFIDHLKHISYHTATEILYKDYLIIPRAEAIRDRLHEEMRKF